MFNLQYICMITTGMHTCTWGLSYTAMHLVHIAMWIYRIVGFPRGPISAKHQFLSLAEEATKSKGWQTEVIFYCKNYNPMESP